MIATEIVLLYSYFTAITILVKSISMISGQPLR